jgi:hypothetical protein
MALTLVEAYKMSSDPIQSAVIEMFARESTVLQVLPFDDIQGNALRYNREESLPGVGFRGINEAYSESTGILNPITEPLMIAGGDLDVDNFIIRTQGPNARAIHEAMKVKALALNWTLKFLKGDQATQPKEFDGLQVRCTGNQLISAGTTNGGAALSLAKLDEGIDAVDGPTHLIMSKAMVRRLSQAARNASVGGYITYQEDAFGRRVTHYNDLPILIVDKDNTNTDILPFSEAAYAGGATATSIYVVSLGEGKIMGIQSGVMDVRDMGELETKSCRRTRVEWFNGLSVYHGRAAARIQHIGDLAVVA